MRVKCPFCFEIRNGVIFIDYRDRRSERPMAIPPSIGKQIISYEDITSQVEAEEELRESEEKLRYLSSRLLTAQ